LIPEDFSQTGEAEIGILFVLQNPQQFPGAELSMWLEDHILPTASSPHEHRDYFSLN
jgi:hypothetical protein